MRGSLGKNYPHLLYSTKLYEDKKMTPLAVAAQEGHLDIVKLLLDYKFNQKQEIIGKALCCAVEKDHLEVVEHLLNNDCNVQEASKENLGSEENLLFRAMETENEDLIGALLPFYPELSYDGGDVQKRAKKIDEKNNNDKVETLMRKKLVPIRTQVFHRKFKNKKPNLISE